MVGLIRLGGTLGHLQSLQEDWPALLPALLTLLPALLLAGRGMQLHFERRASRFNRWAGVGQRVHALRWLLLTQAFALEILYVAFREEVLPWAAPVLTLVALGVLGIGLQRTWGLLLLLTGVAAELGLALLALGSAPTEPPLRALGLPLALGLLALLSLVQLFPFTRAMARALRSPG